MEEQQASHCLPEGCRRHLTSLCMQGTGEGLSFLPRPFFAPENNKACCLAASATTTGNQSVVERQMGVENPLSDVRLLLSPVLKITRFIRN